MSLTVYELQDQIKELLKRVEELESNRCRCASCQMHDFLEWQVKERVIEHEEENRDE